MTADIVFTSTNHMIIESYSYSVACLNFNSFAFA